MIIDRRTALLFGAAGMATPFAGAAGADSGEQSLSLGEDPQAHLDALARVMGATDGEPGWMAGAGRIYAFRDGEMPIPLFGVEGLRYIKFEREDDGYRMFVRDWGYFTDYETGQVLESFRNPFTGALNQPKPLLTRYFSWVMGPNGQNMEGYTGDAWLMNRPYRLPVVAVGDQATATLELLVKYGDGGFGGEWVNMTVPRKQIDDASVSRAEMSYSWTGYSPWARWMEMEDRPGRTLWNSNGQKFSRATDIPAKLYDNLETFFPGSLAAPETYERTSGLTSTEE